jgi:hypothetical protein
MAGHVIVFQHRDFRGQHRHIFNEERNFSHPEDSSLNDQVSSFIVIEGKWKFYRHSGFGVPYDGEFGPGEYPWVADVQVENDQISSAKCISG